MPARAAAAPTGRLRRSIASDQRPCRRRRSAARSLPNIPRHDASGGFLDRRAAMHTRPTSQIDEAAGLAYAAARGFGLVIASDAGRPVASPLPFVVEPANAVRRLAFHVARGNRLAELAAQGGSWLLVVMGPDAYVSPDWYASAEQVPTWLYETVHLSGPVRVIPGDHTQGHAERLSAKFEGWIDGKQPWLLDKVSDKRRDMLLKGIIAVEMTVETMEG